MRKKVNEISRTNCKNCGDTFINTNNTQKYCSVKCRTEYWTKSINQQRAAKDKTGNYLQLRFEILKRDNFRCVYCGRNPKEDNIKLAIDHIHPKARNGDSNADNLITTCYDCNTGKSDILLSERKIKKSQFLQSTRLVKLH
jgi:5-methylcytosine-specific restriction endonuclease McrA